jgi:AcrR family transcriptional regulator
MCQYVNMKSSPSLHERRSDALSKERITATAITILDIGGDSALTFRRLAKQLQTGAGAIYHYVANKDELLSVATNAVIAEALSTVATNQEPDKAIEATAFALFDAFEAHPWAGYELTQENRRNGLGFAQICEALGSKLDALGVPSDAQFNVASALSSYITGFASQNAANARLGKIIAQEGFDRTMYLTKLATRWKQQLDPAVYPFVHQLLDKIPTHDDREQFIAGINLMLAGITKLH